MKNFIKKHMKKICSLGLAVVSCLGMATMALADTSTGAAGFAAALTDSNTGITSAALWGELTAFAGLMVTIFIFAFGYGRVKRIYSSGSKGKARI